GKVELRRLADDLHRQRVVVVEALGADADALLAQAGEDLAAAVSDAGDEAESGDDDSRGHSVRGRARSAEAAFQEVLERADGPQLGQLLVGDADVEGVLEEEDELG